MKTKTKHPPFLPCLCPIKLFWEVRTISHMHAFYEKAVCPSLVNVYQLLQVA